jgi:hypothetical protein
MQIPVLIERVDGNGYRAKPRRRKLWRTFAI